MTTTNTSFEFFSQVNITERIDLLHIKRGNKYVHHSISVTHTLLSSFGDRTV